VQILGDYPIAEEARLVDEGKKSQGRALWDLYNELTKRHLQEKAEWQAERDQLLKELAELKLKYQILEEKYNELINKPKANSNNSSIAPSQDPNRSKKKLQKQKPQCKPFRP
jgi:regulator of protease activity HflC (stomatin/prohibitin superfamily)